MEKEITNIELLESINRSFSNVEKRFSEIEEKMVTKDDLESFKLEMNVNFNNLGSDLKSFKNDTDESTKTTKDDVADLLDTVMIHDKRIEKLENKFV
ncbi:MAG: hypothetical protein WCK10_03870 [Candidatus Staskawiczbacteria bacterium]